MDGGGAESGAPPGRAHEVHVFKPTTSDVLPNTKYEVTGMARALIRQVTNFHTASRKLDEMEPVNGDSDSEGHLKVRMQRDRALLQIQRFSWNFKQGNFVDFNPEVSALSSAKAVSANANKRKLNCISPPGISVLQAGSQLIRIQQPIAIDLQAHQVQQQQAQQQLQMQQMQQQQVQQQQVNAWIGGTGSNHLALSTPPNSRSLDTGAFGDAIARNRAMYNQHNAQELQHGPRIIQQGADQPNPPTDMPPIAPRRRPFRPHFMHLFRLVLTRSRPPESPKATHFLAHLALLVGPEALSHPATAQKSLGRGCPPGAAARHLGWAAPSPKPLRAA